MPGGRPFSSFWKWGLAGALAIGAAVIGVTFALADGSTPPTYYACVNNSSGTIKLVSATTTCSQNEQKIEWNQSGPAGPAGQPGAPGAPGKDGKDGSNGLSQAYVARTSVTHFQIVDAFTSALVVAELSDLPAGSYVVTADETTTFPPGAWDNGLANGIVRCALTPGSAHGAQGVIVGGIGSAVAQTANVAVTDGVTLAETGSIKLTCSGPLGLSSDSAVLTAIPVDTLTEQASSQGPSFTASIHGRYADTLYPNSCNLILNGSGLQPNSSINFSVNGDTAQDLGVSVASDGTLNTLTYFPFPADGTSTLTLYATPAGGGDPVIAIVSVSSACNGL